MSLVRDWDEKKTHRCCCLDFFLAASLPTLLFLKTLFSRFDQITMPLNTLKRIGTALLNTRQSSPSPDAATETTTKESLFPVVTKEEDGDDCDHDCDACPGYPRSFEKVGIDTDDKLWGSIKKYSTHVIVATGETDWIRDVDQIDGSVMQKLSKLSGSVRNGV